MASEGVRLGASQVRALFPYLIEIDQALQLTAIGRSMGKVCPEVAIGASLLAAFRLPRNVLRPSFEALRARADQVFFLESISSGIKLRGLWSLDEGGDRLVFVGSPWFTEMDQVERSGLVFRDFTPLDPLLDFLAMTQAKDVALEDARRMSRLVEQQRDELRTTNEQLVRAAVKTQFLANTSHELRTPLAGILGMAGLLQRSSLSTTQRTQVDRLVRSAQGLLVIVNDLLDLSKLEAGKLAIEQLDTDLWSIVEDSAELFAASAEQKGVTLSCRVDPAVPHRVTGDPNRLRQILGNLLGNAVKFTEQGRVELRVTVEPSGELPLVRFEVRDTGIGIDPAKPLFLPFEQADGSMARRFGGTGLGLAIVRELVTLMGGTIGAERNPDVGSTFWVSLPLPPLGAELPTGQEAANRTSQASPDHPPVGPMPSLAPPGITLARAISVVPVLVEGAPRILVVDDNPVNRELAAAMLEELGVACDLVASGPDALVALAEHPYPLVLMDLQMPGMDGLATTRALRLRERSHTPVVAVSALAMAEDRQRALAEGMDGYLTKPYSLADLAAVIGKWVRSPGRRSPSIEPPRISRIEALRQLSAGDDFLCDIVRLFMDDLPVRRRSIQEAFAGGNAQEVRDVIHGLRSGALALGVTPLCGVCLSIEELARAGELEAARMLLPTFEGACDAALRTLATLLPSAAVGAPEPGPR